MIDDDGTSVHGTAKGRKSGQSSVRVPPQKRLSTFYKSRFSEMQGCEIASVRVQLFI